jgi:hypothetical protein
LRWDSRDVSTEERVSVSSLIVIFAASEIVIWLHVIKRKKPRAEVGQLGAERDILGNGRRSARARTSASSGQL